MKQSKQMSSFKNNLESIFSTHYTRRGRVEGRIGGEGRGREEAGGRGEEAGRRGEEGGRKEEIKKEEKDSGREGGQEEEEKADGGNGVLGE